MTMPTTAESAIVGMSCRLSGADSYHAYWDLLVDRRVSVSEVPASRWRWQDHWGEPRATGGTSNCRWGAFLPEPFRFDAAFFGMSPREAESIDPQQRLLLELTWSCLEDAGIRPSSLAGKSVGVYVGVMNVDYRDLVARTARDVGHYHETGLQTSVVANRISHWFDFRGPSLTIETACSSALCALHLARQALRCGECELALAGGVHLMLAPRSMVAASQLGVLSPSGTARPFDTRADGTVAGEGGGLVLLQPLAQARADRRRILGVVRGSAVNHGGRSPSLSHPRADAQAAVIRDALGSAGLTPADLAYVETHGAGTPKGDRIELEAIEQVLSAAASGSGRRDRCALGTVKPNVGHLGPAAGITAVIKVLLSFQHGWLPPNVHADPRHSRVTPEHPLLWLIDRLTNWPGVAGELGQGVAGVSAFGFSGTNAHVILSDWPRDRGITPPASSDAAATRPHAFVLSAKTAAVLRQRADDLALYLRSTRAGGEQLAAIAYTLAVGREPMEHRLGLTASSTADVADMLERVAAGATDIPNLSVGRVDRATAACERPAPALTGAESLVGLWVRGRINAVVDPEAPSIPVALPTYPFTCDVHVFRMAAEAPAEV
jgi:polyketide synthase PksN